MNEQADMQETQSDDTTESQQPGSAIDEEEIEGLDSEDGSWGDYPLDDLLIRHEGRTIYDVIRRIDKGTYVMDPRFPTRLHLAERQAKQTDRIRDHADSPAGVLLGGER